MLSSLAALSADFMSKQMPSQKVEPQGENFASCFVGSRLEEVLLKKKNTAIIRNQQTVKKEPFNFFLLDRSMFKVNKFFFLSSSTFTAFVSN